MRLCRRPLQVRAEKDGAPASAPASLPRAGIRTRVLIFNLQTMIVDETDAKAQAKYQDYKSYINLDGALTLGSGWMGIDFGAYAPDEPLRQIKTNAVQSSVDAFSSADPEQGVDRARTGRMDRHRRPRPLASSAARHRRRSPAGMGGGDRRRRFQPRLCRDARDLRGHRRTIWCRSFSVAASTRRPIRRARCVKSCSARARVCRPTILRARYRWPSAASMRRGRHAPPNESARIAITMPKQIRLNAFEMNCVAHQSPGLWRHPRDQSADYGSSAIGWSLPELWNAACSTACFSPMCSASTTFSVATRTPRLRHAAQIPVNDPLLLVPAMAAATAHLGFGVTVNLSYEPPYGFARRMSTLDHLSEGRIGWNIVTGYLDSAAKGAGRASQTAHDDRYAIAEDYMEVVYKLWEGSWADDAVKADAVERRVHRSRRSVRKVKHGALTSDRRHASRRALAAAHAGALSGRHLAGRAMNSPRAMPNACSYPARAESGDRAARGKHPPQAVEAARSARTACCCSLCSRRSWRPAMRKRKRDWRVSPLCRSRGRADIDVRLDGDRFFTARSRSIVNMSRTTRAVRAGKHHPRRSRPSMDRARGRRTCLDRRHRPVSSSARPRPSPMNSK